MIQCDCLGTINVVLALALVLAAYCREEAHRIPVIIVPASTVQALPDLWEYTRERLCCRAVRTTPPLPLRVLPTAVEQ